ncbi:hypothetical protein [Olleya sp. R77988]|uniref:hypothetical protein n=1 Tax=Olleya sp. R77988 TaxID=3093875 RepID=UPI0037C5285B
MKNVIKTIFFLITIVAFMGCSNDDDSSVDEVLPTGTGKIIFYSFEDINCGTITITLDGRGNGTMDSAMLPSSTVHCQDTHSSMHYFRDLPQGDYTFTASCTSYNWSGSISLGNGTCYSYALSIGSAN